MNIYLEINCLVCNNAAELHYSFFISISIAYVTAGVLHSNYTYHPVGDDNTDSATWSQHVQSLVTHGITDKAAYLSKVTK